MRRTREPGAHRAKSSVLLAALALAASILPGPAAAAPAAPRPAIERRFEAAMSAKRWREASSLADSLVRTRELRERLPARQAAAILDSLGRRLFLAGDPGAWAAAEPLFRAGLVVRELALGPDDPAVAASLATLATLFDYLGRWAEAVPLAERAVGIRSRVLGERRPETAASLRQLGLLRFQLGDYAGAATPLERSQAIYDSLGAGFEAKAADGLNNLGELARVRDRLDEAEARFRRGLEIARAALPPDDPTRLGLGNNLAGLLKDRGRYDEAEPLLESGLAILEHDASDPEALATARLNLAEVRRLQGRPERAAALYASALEEARRALGARHPGLVPFLNQTAVCEQDLGHFARAESLYRETGEVLEATLGPEHPLLAQNLVDLARFELAEHARTPDRPLPEEVDSLLARARALRERSLGPDHPDVALVMLEQARSRALEPGAAATVGALLGRAIAILDSSGAYPDARLDAYAQRARWHGARGERDPAMRDMAVALAARDSLRAWRGGGDQTRAAYMASQLDLVDLMVGWQLEAGEVDAALATHERSRARTLLDQIAASGVDLRAGIPAARRMPLETHERAAEAALAAVHRAIQDARADGSVSARERLETLAALEARRDSAALELAVARRRIEDASPLWRDILGAGGGGASVAQLQHEVVPRDGMLLDYHVGEKASWVFVVPSRGAARAYALKLDSDAAAVLGEAAGPLGSAALERIVGGRPADAAGGEDPGIVGLLGGTPVGGFLSLPLRSKAAPDSFELRLNALWRTLVPEALRRPLRAARTAVVVPDGALQLVAFEALVTEPRGRAKATRYWLDDGPAIAYGPSAASLLSLALRPRAANAPAAGRAPVFSVSNVAFASPAIRGRTWSPLPGTALESRSIEEAFGPGQVETLSGSEAREPAVRAGLAGRRYVHLATHGFTDVSPERLLAGLVLAPPPSPPRDSDDDGLLELFEIHRLSLGCELAMLSACETARGPRVAGEGSFALSRAFLAAGARRVVASLWAVDDRAAPVVVRRLFDAVAAADRAGRPCDYAAALREAKRALRRDPRWADPFYWAPFVLSGS
ncbi:MAG: CHAT domain-containing protein [Candidatus Eisenbacteria bacterium]|nr:CHAT domain-containing protein [Candidatus Eisenbacteria bacterium]